MAILDLEITGRLGKTAKTAAINQRLGLSLASNSYTALRNSHSCSTNFGGAKLAAYNRILETVSFRSCANYFEFLAYRAMKFFLPNGGIPRSDRKRPLGLYQATRPSLAFQNKLIRSAFLFYENPPEQERLFPYGTPGLGNVLRFKEFRSIAKAKPNPYQILSGGLLFNNRHCYIGVGVSYETKLGLKEIELTDIPHIPSKFMEFVPLSHRQGNCIPYAAIRWHDFGNRPALGRPLGHFSRHPDTPLLSLSPRRRFPRPTPERVFVADHQSSSGFSGTGPSAPPPQPIGT